VCGRAQMFDTVEIRWSDADDGFCTNEFITDTDVISLLFIVGFTSAHCTNAGLDEWLITVSNQINFRKSVATIKVMKLQRYTRRLCAKMWEQFGGGVSGITYKKNIADIYREPVLY
jgi:hypothetical protein